MSDDYTCAECGSENTTLALRAREMFDPNNESHAWNGPVQVVRCRNCDHRWDV